MKTTIDIIGDVHARFIQLEYMLQNSDRVIAIGDIGVGFDMNTTRFFNERIVNQFPNFEYIRGNHDNPKVIKQLKNYIPDGTTREIQGVKLFFIGGAWSIDGPNPKPGFHPRTEGVNWWSDEECSDEEFESFRKTYFETKPDIMITHECPYFCHSEMFRYFPNYENRTALFFDELFKIHSPSYWIFGHHHVTRQHKVGNCIFQCLGELDLRQLIIENGQSELIRPERWFT